MTQTAKQYQTDLSEIPAQHRATFAHINDCIARAFTTDRPVKVTAGYYLQVQNGELVTIERNEELAGSEKWVAQEYNEKWHGADPKQRMSDLVI